VTRRDDGFFVAVDGFFVVVDGLFDGDAVVRSMRVAGRRSSRRRWLRGGHFAVVGSWSRRRGGGGRGG